MLGESQFLNLDNSGINMRTFLMENIKAIENRPGDQELCNALRKVLNKPISNVNRENFSKMLRILF